MDNNRLLTTREAASYLCVSKAFLERDRWEGASIPFVRIGSRSVRYKATDLEAYVQARREQRESRSDAIDA